ncbi:hypothetical protein, partial [Klebsiella pneumoniae]|uniref:hypothetical protein n=1 Tax=Klebsiella pneumoniae TaxID=573 RepID=UPI0038529668
PHRQQYSANVTPNFRAVADRSEAGLGQLFHSIRARHVPNPVGPIGLPMKIFALFLSFNVTKIVSI